MDFILGCNYWASHAGTEMWINWNPKEVENDLKVLSQNGVRYLRVFPNWRDFQPVIPLYTEKGTLYEYRMENGKIADNSEYLDKEMMNHFKEFCELASRHNMQLIVGLLTGWMSGRLFIPSVLYGKDLFTDPLALLLEQKFIRGFISQMKDQPVIYAWDLGNECNCMGNAASTDIAENWTMIIANSIRSADPHRQIISGMHSLKLDDGFTIRGQAENTDILTTHPYPLWVPHCSLDKMRSIRTLLHATAETTLYSSIGNKPCLVEELGTMGPMICDEQTAADFMRVNLFSNWAAGAPGVMWWCAHDQSQLTTAPYSWNMCERELGLLTSQKESSPALLEMKKFGEWLRESKITLEESTKDAVCLLTKEQDHWGVGYMCYILAKQAGLNIIFHDANETIPDAGAYLLPSITGTHVMPMQRYHELLQKVSAGSTLYISNQDAFLTEFEELTGMHIIDSAFSENDEHLILDGVSLPFHEKKHLELSPAGANILAADSKNHPVLSVNHFQKGTVYYLNFPLEQMLLNKNNAFDCSYELLYQKIFKAQTETRLIKTECPYIGITEHPGKHTYAVLINYSAARQQTCLRLTAGWEIKKIHYGNADILPGCDAAVLELECR